MNKAILGTKIGMTQIFDENGKVIPVTVVMAGPCTVVAKKTVETDGYEAVKVGFGSFLSFIVGTGVKVVVATMITYYIARDLFQQVVAMF